VRANEAGGQQTLPCDGAVVGRIVKDVLRGQTGEHVLSAVQAGGVAKLDGANGDGGVDAGEVEAVEVRGSP